MKSRRAIAWGLVACVLATLVLMAWLMPTPKPGAFMVLGFSTSYQPMQPEYVWLSWLSGAVTVLVAVLLDDDLWSD